MLPVVILFGSLALVVSLIVCGGLLAGYTGIFKDKDQDSGTVARSEEQQPAPPSKPVSVKTQFKEVVQTGTPQEVQSFLDVHPDEELLTTKIGKYGMALHHAVVYGRDGTAALLLDRGAEINAQGKNGQTPLYVACRMKNRLNMVRLLLKRGADVSIKSSMGYTPRQQAAFVNNYKAIEILDKHATMKSTPD